MSVICIIEQILLLPKFIIWGKSFKFLVIFSIFKIVIINIIFNYFLKDLFTFFRERERAEGEADGEGEKQAQWGLPMWLNLTTLRP